MTAPSEDAVGVARLALDTYHEAMTYDVDEYLELRDALIRAVRTECAAPREVSEAMVEAFRSADYCEKGKLEHEHVIENCDECVRIGLRAALSAETGAK